MDGTVVAETSALYDWIASNGQVVYFFAQVGYWLFMVLLVGYAVAQYKRWVNFQLGTGHSGKLRNDINADQAVVEADKPKREPIQVEEFVE